MYAYASRSLYPVPLTILAKLVGTRPSFAHARTRTHTHTRAHQAQPQPPASEDEEEETAEDAVSSEGEDNSGKSSRSPLGSPLWYWSGSGRGSRCSPLYQGSASEAAGASGKVLGTVLHALWAVWAVPRMTSSRPLGTLASVVYGRLWTEYVSRRKSEPSATFAIRLARSEASAGTVGALRPSQRSRSCMTITMHMSGLTAEYMRTSAGKGRAVQRSRLAFMPGDMVKTQ